MHSQGCANVAFDTYLQQPCPVVSTYTAPIVGQTRRLHQCASHSNNTTKQLCSIIAAIVGKKMKKNMFIKTDRTKVYQFYFNSQLFGCKIFIIHLLNVIKVMCMLICNQLFCSPDLNTFGMNSTSGPSHQTIKQPRSKKAFPKCGAYNHIK